MATFVPPATATLTCIIHLHNAVNHELLSHKLVARLDWSSRYISLTSQLSLVVNCTPPSCTFTAMTGQPLTFANASPSIAKMDVDSKHVQAWQFGLLFRPCNVTSGSTVQSRAVGHTLPCNISLGKTLTCSEAAVNDSRCCCDLKHVHSNTPGILQATCPNLHLHHHDTAAPETTA